MVQLEEYDAEFKQMKNQEVHVRELELKVRDLESQLSEKSNSASDQLLHQWQLERSELIQDFKSREQQTNSELQSTREKLLKTQLAHDKVQAQLLKMSDSTCISCQFVSFFLPNNIDLASQIKTKQHAIMRR